MGLVGDSICASIHAGSSDTAESLLLKLTAKVPIQALQAVSEYPPGRQQSMSGILHPIQARKRMRNPEPVIRTETKKIRV